MSEHHGFSECSDFVFGNHLAGVKCYFLIQYNNNDSLLHF